MDLLTTRQYLEYHQFYPLRLLFLEFENDTRNPGATIRKAIFQNEKTTVERARIPQKQILCLAEVAELVDHKKTKCINVPQKHPLWINHDVHRASLSPKRPLERRRIAADKNRPADWNIPHIK